MDKKEQLLTDFRDFFNKMVWLNRLKMEESLKGHKPSEVHCIEFIEKIEDANVTKLAESLYMTRGAISKLTKKLIIKALSKAIRSRLIRKKSISGLPSKEKSFIKFTRNCTKSFKNGTKSCLNK